MKRHERRLWAAATTIPELGELTAQWLEGTLRETPSYLGPPDPETEPLKQTLAAFNRAGFVTAGSQPGCDETIDGVHWSQRAGVDILAPPDSRTSHLRTAARKAQLLVISHDDPPRRVDYSEALAVTKRNGATFTRFGVGLSKRALRFEFDGCSREALNAVCGARQLTIVDPTWGRNDRLWPMLEQVTAVRTGT